ncbi:hypothetical protein BCR34DRAFT_605713 [Clohesyomyces aquaticus]|uniref:Uncharacterized protein n=1 Tax=Clohesyomyces aquaticus TaxID=1231657 RepID=A0A1Y1YVJ9_9PLEO|nr:hypothetical protein BCR34DRAFT_605713 [Clohesyomyces aquaticus]
MSNARDRYNTRKGSNTDPERAKYSMRVDPQTNRNATRTQTFPVMGTNIIHRLLLLIIIILHHILHLHRLCTPTRLPIQSSMGNLIGTINMSTPRHSSTEPSTRNSTGRNQYRGRTATQGPDFAGNWTEESEPIASKPTKPAPYHSYNLGDEGDLMKDLLIVEFKDSTKSSGGAPGDFEDGFDDGREIGPDIWWLFEFPPYKTRDLQQDKPKGVKNVDTAGGRVVLYSEADWGASEFMKWPGVKFIREATSKDFKAYKTKRAANSSPNKVHIAREDEKAGKHDRQGGNDSKRGKDVSGKEARSAKSRKT